MYFMICKSSNLSFLCLILPTHARTHACPNSTRQPPSGPRWTPTPSRCAAPTSRRRPRRRARRSMPKRSTSGTGPSIRTSWRGSGRSTCSRRKSTCKSEYQLRSTLGLRASQAWQVGCLAQTTNAPRAPCSIIGPFILIRLQLHALIIHCCILISYTHSHLSLFDVCTRKRATQEAGGDGGTAGGNATQDGRA